MTQPKTDLAYLRSEKAKAEQQLRYYQHREKILEHQIPELTRKARVHRLCTRAGMLESFLIAPEELTNDQVMELLKIAFRQPEVALALAKMIHPSVSPVIEPSGIRTGKPVRRTALFAWAREADTAASGEAGRDAKSPRPPKSCFIIESKVS